MHCNIVMHWSELWTPDFDMMKYKETYALLLNRKF